MILRQRALERGEVPIPDPLAELVYLRLSLNANLNLGRTLAEPLEEPGSAGVIAMDHYARHVLQGRDFRGVRSTGSKAERARPLAAALSNGLVSLRSEAPWVRDLTNEMRSFPLGTHDDQVDAMSGAMTALTQQDRVQSVLPSITTTVRNKMILSTSPWLPAHALASLVAFPPAERFPTKNWAN